MLIFDTSLPDLYAQQQQDLSPGMPQLQSEKLGSMPDKLSNMSKKPGNMHPLHGCPPGEQPSVHN